MNLLDSLYRYSKMENVWSLDSTISYWLKVEAELAGALADADVISRDDANAIDNACVIGNIDTTRLIRESANVGYPIVSLISMVCESLTP